MPKSFNHYYEPFLGGGAMFFDLAPEHATVSDANLELVSCYLAVALQVGSVIHELKKLPIDEKRYYALRSLKPADLSPAAAAARTIYLNHTDFNGLYRVNKSGGFNVPWGKWKDDKLPTTCDEENLRACSAALQKARIMCADFQSIIANAEEGSLAYCDPPYVPLTKTANFTTYTPGGFGLEDLKRLRASCCEARQRGAYVMLSQADTPEVREMFGGFRIHSVSARRNVNCDASKRGKVGEVVITSYEVEP